MAFYEKSIGSSKKTFGFSAIKIKQSATGRVTENESVIATKKDEKYTRDGRLLIEKDNNVM